MYIIWSDLYDSNFNMSVNQKAENLYDGSVGRRGER